ncbi:MAG: rod shape-determining protein MreC [Candidatus Eutrophobiaceae bacterium]
MIALFSKNHALFMRMSMFALISAALMALDFNNQVRWLKILLDSAMYPMHLAATLPVETLNWASGSLKSKSSLLEENRKLKDFVFMQESRLQRQDVLEEENKRLYKLLEVADRVDDRIMVAKLFAADIQPWRQLVTINKGSRDGAYVGQPVIDAYGIMGQIAEVTPLSSKVLLITDPSHSLPVQINRNGLRGYVSGVGDARKLQLEHLPVDADIKRGDLVVTSGLGQRFPFGYVVGKVLEVHSGTDLDVIVEPAAQLNQSREVLIVWPAHLYQR